MLNVKMFQKSTMNNIFNYQTNNKNLYYYLLKYLILFKFEFKIVFIIVHIFKNIMPTSQAEIRGGLEPPKNY